MDDRIQIRRGVEHILDDEVTLPREAFSINPNR